MTVIDILELFFAGGGFVTLLIFFIKRHDDKKNEYKELREEDETIKRELKKLEKDSVRTQLLLLMSHYQPEDQHELLQVAEHYFVDLDANWYLTPKFNRFLEEQNIARPEWFKK